MPPPIHVAAVKTGIVPIIDENDISPEFAEELRRNPKWPQPVGRRKPS